MKNSANNAFASPSDFLVRHGRRERAAQFGLSDEHEESFELNQSFPRLNAKPQPPAHLTPDLNRLKGYELSSINFLKQPTLMTTQFNTKKNYLLNETVYSPMDSSNAAPSSNKSWLFYNQFVNTRALLNASSYGGGGDAVQMISNPNKAVVVINGRTSEVLTANDVACELFGRNGEELSGRRLRELLVNDDDSESEILMESDRLDEHGRAVLCSGKIFDAIVDGSEERIPVSVYIVKLTDDAHEPRCLCVMEPIQRVLGTFAINLKGRIRYYNSNFSYIFGYSNNPLTETSTLNQHNSPRPLSNLSAFSLLNGKDICDLIPNMKLPMSNIQPEIRRQALTGRSCQGENIPITVTILNKKLYNNEEIVYNCSVSVYMNISGLVTVRASDSKINSYNGTFARLLLGYDEKQLIGKPITSLLTNFFEPDVSSTAAMRYNTSKPSTPLRVNASYLNVENNNTNMRALAPNSSSRSCSAASRHRTQAASSLQQLPVVPKFVITEPSSSAGRASTFSGSNGTTAATNGDSEPSQSSSTSMHPNVHYCFNCNALLDSNNDLVAPITDDMCSPSKKCANYLDSNIFPSSSGVPMAAPSQPSLPTTPQSTQAKRSLLARAIKNNMAQLSINLFGGSSASLAATAVLNRSIDDVSMLSNNCASTAGGTGDLSTDAIADVEPASPSADLNSSFQSDFSAASSITTPESSPQRKRVEFNEENNQLHEDNEIDDEDEEMDYSLNHSNRNMNEEDESRKMWNWCEKCRAEAARKSDRNMMDDEDVGSECSDVESIDEQHTKSGRKRKPDEAVAATTVATAAEGEEDSSKKKFKNQVTSTPAAGSLDRKRQRNQLDEGMFFGKARHVDGKLIRVVYQRKYLNEEIICVWISRDPYSDKSIIDCSVDQSMFHKTNQTFSDANNAYTNEYEDVSVLGRGASGFVQLARRRVDQFEVVTKYILKSKIYNNSWINDSRYGTIPMEVSILCKIDHANIVKVLEVFNEPSDDHIQMVMEKHGEGMDLFEYIDRQRQPVNELVASGIFRQIVSAVSYLHSHGIVHRDIKDENIIIDDKFHIKLIDFGSAAYFTPGKKFSTFCGTLDYCSPDVLLGNKYFGPELDVWTCGIALYTLVYCENPFADTNATIECILKPPYKVSNELTSLIMSILCADPEQRATIKEIETDEWVTQPVDLSKFVWSEVLYNTKFVSNNTGEVENQPDELKELNYKAKKSSKENQNQDSQATSKKNQLLEKILYEATENRQFDHNLTF